jgi:radical SAM protein with 4Fe4S-binding SPASM domain
LSIQASTATEGNLQTQSLAEIWRKPGAFTYNRQFTPRDLGGFCATCVHAEICRGGCLSMRTCEGGGENPFCYHRVATLAERAAKRSRARYVPMVIAPAALLALVGCSSEVVDEYGAPVPARDAASDMQDAQEEADTSQPITDAYGIPPVDAQLYGIDAAPAYAIEDAPLYAIDAAPAYAIEDAPPAPPDGPDTGSD